jgi:RNA polymerase sigma-70 factor (sigma-E family)
MPPIRRDQRRAAFEQFVGKSTGSLLRTAYFVTGDAGHSEDLVQEALFKVARRWSRVVTMDSPQAYARRILVNLALDDSKRRSRHRAELARQSPPDGSLSHRWESETSWGGIAACDDRLELIRALGELPPRQRAILVLRFLDDLSESEVASTLGCSVGNVKSTTSRALEKMRELVPDNNELVPNRCWWPEPAVDGLTCSVRKGERP